MGAPSRLALRVQGQTRWLGEGEGLVGRYELRSLVAQVSESHPDLGLTLDLLDWVHPDLDVLVRRIQIRNSSSHAKDVVLRSHHDLRMGGDSVQGSVAWDPTSQALLHYRRDRWLLIGCHADEPGWHGYTCDARSVENGRGCAAKVEQQDSLDGNPVAVGSVDTAGELRFHMESHEVRTCAMWWVLGESEPAVQQIQEEVRRRGISGLLEETRTHWSKKTDRLLAHPGIQALPKTEQDDAIRDLLVIGTQLDRGGAIAAANDSDTLDPGQESYAYLWPRDGALVAHALDRANLHDWTEPFFRFCARVLNTDGSLAHRYHPDGTQGSSWLPRIREGAPSHAIQEDETALVLWALAHHVQESPRGQMVTKDLYGELVEPAAEFLVHFRDDETGLPRPSWDLWEERYATHTFTCASVVAGLLGAAQLAERSGKGANARKWTACAEDIRDATNRFLFHKDLNRFARCGYRDGNGYHLDTTLDASLLGLWSLGFLPDDDARLKGTLSQLGSGLGNGPQDPGLCRYENDPFLKRDPESLGNPWILTTLWFQQYDLTNNAPSTDRALEVLHWVRSLARPSGVLPEQVDPRTLAPVGVAPLTWSHATRLELLLTLGTVLASR